MSDTAYLALLLDAPLQSWGFASRFQRRTTGLHPTKSGVIGLICAAMGLAKGSPEEQTTLPELAKLKMTSIAIPRVVQPAGLQPPVLRLEDYHTVQGTRRAFRTSGIPSFLAIFLNMCSFRSTRCALIETSLTGTPSLPVPPFCSCWMVLSIPITRSLSGTIRRALRDLPFGLK